MAERDNITIPLELPPDEAAALAQFIKRIGYSTCVKLANRHKTYPNDGRSEADVMWSAIRMLQQELAEAGFAPR